MKSFFRKYSHNKDLISCDALLKMIRREIINDELKDHHNMANRRLSHLQKQRGRGHSSHLMDLWVE